MSKKTTGTVDTPPPEVDVAEFNGAHSEEPTSEEVTDMPSASIKSTNSLQPLLYQHNSNKAPHPVPDRDTTKRVVQSILEKPANPTVQQRPWLSNVHGDGPLLLSDIPESCKAGFKPANSTARNDAGSGVILGIDEAGRGSVLGPMTYGCAYWNRCDADSIPNDFNDSKQLSEKTRELLLQKILHTPTVGFALRVLHASEISRNMLRPVPYNLNAMSHNAAIDIIRKLLDAGVPVQECFIDTVGIAEHYQRRLEREFPGIDFTVESKADANYAVCSAASVVAKVLRDALLDNWNFTEATSAAAAEAAPDDSVVVPTDTAFGSGYPGDPTCKAWMEKHLGASSCPVFGFPDLVRFSWKPAKVALENAAADGSNKDVAKVTFKADLDVDDEENNEFKLSGIKRHQEQLTSFFNKSDGTPAKKKRYPFFHKRGLDVVSKL